MRILIIDDEPYLIRALTLLLEHDGHEVLQAYDGTDGLAKLLAEQPDMAIVDVMMPGIDGVQLIRAWRSERDQSCDTRLIMLTASCEEEIRTAIQGLGNVQLVAKPFSPRHILRLVQETTALHTTRRDVG